MRASEMTKKELEKMVVVLKKENKKLIYQIKNQAELYTKICHDSLDRLSEQSQAALERLKESMEKNKCCLCRRKLAKRSK